MKTGRVAAAARAALVVGLAGAVVAGCGTREGKGTHRALAEAKALVEGYGSPSNLPERLAPDGTTIVVGYPTARSAVHVYEDPRCPVVEEYEKTGALAVQELVLKRQVRVEYTFASFKDDRLGGDGSKRAVNALRAALDAGKFVEYHAVLFDNQITVENSGGFTAERLLKLADNVPGLRSETFDSAVKTMKHKSFVTASQQTYQRTGDDPIGPGTPTLVVNGRHVDGGLYGMIFEPVMLTRLVENLDRKPGSWETIYKPLKEALETGEAQESQGR